MQVTRATTPGEDTGTLGTGTLLELRESNTMAVVAFDCTPTCLAILEQEQYQYVEQDQKCHVVLPCLEQHSTTKSNAAWSELLVFNCHVLEEMQLHVILPLVLFLCVHAAVSLLRV